MTAPDKIWAYSYDVNTSQGPLDVWKTINTWSDATVQPITAVEYTRTDLVQAAVAAAYEAAAQALSINAWSHLGTDCYSAGMDAGARHQSKIDYDAIRALATPDQIAALAAKVDASQAPNPAVNGGRCQSDTITLPLEDVKALMEAARAFQMIRAVWTDPHNDNLMRKASMTLDALRERMK